MATRAERAAAELTDDLARIDALGANDLRAHPDRVLSLHRRLENVDAKHARPPRVRAFERALALDGYMLVSKNGFARFFDLPRDEIAGTLFALAETRAPEEKLLNKALKLLPGGLATTEAAHREAVAGLTNKSALTSIERDYRARAKWPAPSRALTRYATEHLDEILAFVFRATR
ncbi:MAG TPA: hypothetical protein VGO62_14590 [Myxococcota bacterium]|jgi:hypothetical protein